MILVIWIGSACVALPDIIFIHLKRFEKVPEDVSDLLMSCQPGLNKDQQTVYQIALIVLLYLLPMICIGVAYIHISLVLWKGDIPGEGDSRSGKISYSIYIYSFSSGISSGISSGKDTFLMYMKVNVEQTRPVIPYLYIQWTGNIPGEGELCSLNDIISFHRMFRYKHCTPFITWSVWMLRCIYSNKYIRDICSLEILYQKVYNVVAVY